jgi:hypothetical protein
MFIKAHIRGGYRAAAHYLGDKGKNEATRLVHMSDPDARDLDEAFHNMWLVASPTKAEKPLFHFSINPFKDERLTDKQVKRIAAAYAAKCNMDIAHHQHVIVEHIKDGRQHFHVMLNRVSEKTGKAIDPGLYKKKARECAREMEVELCLKRLVPKGTQRRLKSSSRHRGQETIKSRKTGSGIRSQLFGQTAKEPKLEPTRPTVDTRGWPEAASHDWESWGHRDTQRFFTRWPELKP